MCATFKKYQFTNALPVFFESFSVALGAVAVMYSPARTLPSVYTSAKRVIVLNNRRKINPSKLNC